MYDIKRKLKKFELFRNYYQESSKYIYTCIYKVMKGNDNALDIISDIMQDREKQRLLREIIDNSLTEMQKLCIIAYYFQEQKQSEIASELGIPENTVKTNLSRAKQKIRQSAAAANMANAAATTDMGNAC